jgi:phage terminase small subunit
MERTPLKRPVIPRRSSALVQRSPDGAKLTPRESKFVEEYLVDFNGVRAARAAGYGMNGGYIASTLIRTPQILAEINRQQVVNREKLELKREDLMRFWYDLAHADPAELIPIRVRCCRHCWGEDHGYQFTDIELRDLALQHRIRHKADRDPPMLDEKGGAGFDQRRDPFSVANGQKHDCPCCSGMGQMNAEPLDFTKLSSGARLLIGGVKIDRFGAAEIKFNDRLRALDKLAEYCGFIKPKKGMWTVDFDDIEDDQLDALIREARARGLLREEEVSKLVDVTPQKTSLAPPSDERVS